MAQSKAAGQDLALVRAHRACELCAGAAPHAGPRGAGYRALYPLPRRGRQGAGATRAPGESRPGRLERVRRRAAVQRGDEATAAAIDAEVLKIIGESYYCQALRRPPRLLDALGYALLARRHLTTGSSSSRSPPHLPDPAVLLPLLGGTGRPRTVMTTRCPFHGFPRYYDAVLFASTALDHDATSLCGVEKLRWVLVHAQPP